MQNYESSACANSYASLVPSAQNLFLAPISSAPQMYSRTGVTPNTQQMFSALHFCLVYLIVSISTL